MNIFIIAGPPGIGKSTNSINFIPSKIPIIDHDLAGYKYKKEGFKDYKELGVLIGNEKIKEYLLKNADFALELNLGFQSHYDYLKSIANFNTQNQVHLILFFTDNIELCQIRAKIRHLNGGHLVDPNIIDEMYNQTFKLLNENKSIFNSIRFVDVTNTSLEPVLENNNPKWLIESGFVQK